MRAAIGFFISLLSDFGLTTLMTRQVSRNKMIAPAFFAETIGLRFYLIIFSLLVFVPYLLLSHLNAVSLQAVIIFVMASLLALSPSDQPLPHRATRTIRGGQGIGHPEENRYPRFSSGWSPRRPEKAACPPAAPFELDAGLPCWLYSLFTGAQVRGHGAPQVGRTR